MSSIEVAGLYTYPIKSCAGLPLSRAEITPRGIKHDRDYMLVDERNIFLSQRRVAALAAVVPRIGEAAVSVSVFDREDMGEIGIPLEVELDDSRLVEATLHGKMVTGQEVSDDISGWFSEYLKKHVKLLRVREDIPRQLKQRYQKGGATNETGFADAFSMLLTSQASLRELNRHMQSIVPMNRFRPNVVVGTRVEGGQLEAYEEDYWRRLQLGNMMAFVVRPCARCAIPDVNQWTGRRAGTAVRDALKATRSGLDLTDPNPGEDEFFFGQNLNHIWQPNLTLSLGDQVTVTHRDFEPNVQFLEAA